MVVVVFDEPFSPVMRKLSSGNFVARENVPAATTTIMFIISDKLSFSSGHSDGEGKKGTTVTEISSVVRRLSAPLHLNLKARKGPVECLTN